MINFFFLHCITVSVQYGVKSKSLLIRMAYPHPKSAVEEIDSSSTLGEIFHEARVKKGITIEQASEHLKIRRAFLRAIEDDMFDDLPGGVYTVGFVGNYAKLLGLNQEKVMSVLNNQVANLQPSFMSIKDPMVSRPKSIGKVYIILSAVITLGIFLLTMMMRHH